MRLKPSFWQNYVKISTDLRGDTTYKNQTSDTSRTRNKLENLLTTLRNLYKLVVHRKFQSSEQHLVDQIEKSIQGCEELILELHDDCQKLNETSTGIKAAAQTASRRLIYSFRQSTLQRLGEDIREMRENLLLAL
jgi:ankyrin repeat domain-containing protein 50